MNNKYRNIGMFLLLALTTACAHHVAELETEPTILFVADNLSPKWDEMTRDLIPARINRLASARYVTFDNITNPRYKLTLKFTNRDKEVAGVSGSGILSAGSVTTSNNYAIGASRSRSKIETVSTVEAEATMQDASGKIVWKWSGYGENRKEKNAVQQLGDKIGKDLMKHGFISEMATPKTSSN